MQHQSKVEHLASFKQQILKIQWHPEVGSELGIGLTTLWCEDDQERGCWVSLMD